VAVDWKRVRQEVAALLELEAGRPVRVVCGGTCGGALALRLSVFRYLKNQQVRCPRCKHVAGCMELAFV